MLAVKDPSYWFDNGFSSIRSMTETYDMVEQVLEGELYPSARILDLGCGNGTLLKRFSRRGVILSGIDGDSRRVNSATKNVPSGFFYKSDLYKDTNFDPKPDILLYSAPRLEKEARKDRLFILEKIKGIRTVLYSYGKAASGRSLLDILWGVYVEFPNKELEIKNVACTNECEAVLLCPKYSPEARSKNSSVSV